MNNFNMDSLRSLKNGRAGKARIKAANDLVKRTLGRHGLAAAGAGLPDGLASSPLPAMDGQLAGFKNLFGNAAVLKPEIPPGAQFRQELYSCTAGSRAYHLYIPSTASVGLTGVVVMLHGCTQNSVDFALGTGMNEQAESHRFIVVYPQQSRGDNAQTCWNWFEHQDQQRDRGEPAILAGMTRKVMAQFGQPAERTFVAGLSAGAAMAVILGETYPDVFAAVGAHSGLPFGAARDMMSAYAAMAGNAPEVAKRDSGTAAVRTIVFHGSADATVHPSNGDRIARHVMDHGSQLAFHADEQGSTSGRNFSRKTMTNSEGVIEMEQWSVDGLGHAWSGGHQGGSYTDTKGPDASAEMVRFFFDDPDGEQS